MTEVLSKAAREQLWRHEQPVVPFPYQWITALNGERRLVKNIGLSLEAQRGEQGQPLKTGKKI